MRVFYLTGGFVSLGLGLVGMALPLLPTVPFMILAAFLFSRSSPRFEAWLVDHRMFGPHIRQWRTRGAISLRGKQAATIAVAFAFGISVFLGVRLTVLAIQALAIAGVMIFIWSRPTAGGDL